MIDLGIQADSLIFGGRQWPINGHFAAHYQLEMGVTTQRNALIWESFDRGIDAREAPANIFFDS